MQTSFRDFFTKCIIEDRTEIFKPNYFRSLYEMALGSMEEPDVVRYPVNIDDDDIQFLQQFPHEFWARALQERYMRLFDRLEKYHQTKEAAGHDVLKNAIYSAIRNQDEKSWTDLMKLGYDHTDENEHIQMSKESVEKLKNKYSSRNTETWSDEKCLDRADMEADEHLKIKFPHLPESENETFEFINNRFDFEKGRLGGSNRNKQKVQIDAKPYLNRLYHKLERTEGLDHLEGSGLEGTKAKYGFMLRGLVRSHDLEKHPHSTAGMKFPTFTQTRNRMQEFLVQNFHRTFGEIDDPDVIWKPTMYEDTETVKFYKVMLLKQFEQELEREFNRNKALADDGDENAIAYIHAKENSTQSERRKKAARMTNAQLITMAEAGGLKGPPIGPTRPGGPPFAPEGLSVEVIDGELVNPKLYLPYKQKTVKFRNKDGTVEEKLEWVPLVKPGKFYRKIEAGENVPEEHKMGYRKNYVHFEGNPYSRGIQKDAAIDFNHNTESLSYLTDEEKEEAQRLILGQQRQVLFHNGQLIPQADSGFYEDFMAGIIQCSESCSGITEHESMIMLQNIYDIHACILQTLMRDMGDHEERYDTSEKRKRYAFQKAHLYSQKNLGEGGGTRRLRAFVQAIRDQRMEHGTPYGQRNLDTREHRNAYKLHNFRAIMQQIANIRATAAQVDATSQRMIQASKDKIGTKISGNLQHVMSNRADIVNQVIEILGLVHQFKHNSKPEESKTWAADQVRSWIELGVSSTELVDHMMALDIVKEIIAKLKESGDDPTDKMSLQQNPGLQDEIRSAIQIARHDLQDQLSRRGNNVNDPEIVARFHSQLPELSPYVKDDKHGGLAQQLMGEFQWLGMSRSQQNWLQHDSEMHKVLSAAQKEINTMLGHHS